ncbi:helix-turn-helix domain-containing protein [Vibrio salinus]|uniref:helix-turn-helix domain-containing protein n=1 Tax=Vibrio salinus TaxID=2899784 RepID=UPI001E5458BA|nr:helix-turn-helix domain-containing protein [Vibrio salinus]MCE0493111.1 helix-turn-helix domain-containing protein [Vibrio salinus]
MTPLSVINELLRQSAESNNLSGIDKATLMTLFSYVNRDFECFPSIKTLSQNSGFSESSTKRAIKKLEELNFITKKRRYSSSGPTSNLYKINILLLLNDNPRKPKIKATPTSSFLAQDGNYYSSPIEFYKTRVSDFGGQIHA